MDVLNNYRISFGSTERVRLAITSPIYSVLLNRALTRLHVVQPYVMLIMCLPASLLGYGLSYSNLDQEPVEMEELALMCLNLGMLG